MRKFLTLLLSVALLAGCAAAPSAAPAESTVPAATAAPAASAAQPADSTAGQAVLDGFVAYAADTAGGSLKTAQAASALVEYLTTQDFTAEQLTAWYDALSAEQSEVFSINWPGISGLAQKLCSDPAAQADLLADAGVQTDFTALDTSAVPQKLSVISAQFDSCTQNA